MKILGNAFAMLVVLALLGALGAGGYFAFDYVAALFSSLDPQTAKIAGFAALVALLAAAIVAGGLRRASGLIANRPSAETHATYRLFVDLWQGLLGPAGAAETREPAETSADLRTLELMLSLYGSPEVLRAHASLRALRREGRTRDDESRREFAKTLLEMRKELRSDTRGLATEELRQLLLPAARASDPAPATRDSRFGAAPAARA